MEEFNERIIPCPTFPVITELSSEQYDYFCKGFIECWNYVQETYNLELKKNGQ